MQNHPSITLEDSPDSEGARIVREGLYQYNLPHAGEDNYKELALIVRGENDTVLGGLLGVTYWSYLNIEVLWIAEEHRGKGLGQKLLNIAEAEAVRRGCKNVHLNTHDFQALAFYQKNGYVIVGELPDLSPGHIRYLLRKALG